MSSEIRNDIICNSNADIMEYLIQKLESRQRNLSKCANIFNTIDSFESFYQRRKDIFNLFNNLEEELHQAALAIKALMVQNKALSQESIEIKTIQKNYNKLLQENNFLLLENNEYAKKLKELNNNNIKSPKRAKSPNFGGTPRYKFNYNNKNNNLNKYKTKKGNYEKKIEYNNKINNLNKNNIKKKQNTDVGYNYDLDLNDIEQLKNAKNIMKDMKDNKNKLKKVIEEHFGKSPNNNYFKNE